MSSTGFRERSQLEEVKSKEVGIRKISIEDFEGEMDEIKVHLSVLEEWIQEYGEDHRCVWKMKKNNMIWNSLQVKLR